MDGHDHSQHIQPMESPREYAKFAAVILGIGIASLGLGWLRGWGLETWMAQFMAVFFLTFGAFKLANLEMFALTFRGYDIITKRFHAWGYIYPFVQLGLGAGYLLIGNADWLNATTIVVSTVAGIGVIQELVKKPEIPCACLGTVIRLPLSKISFVEDFAMLAMATIMLTL